MGQRCLRKKKKKEKEREREEERRGERGERSERVGRRGYVADFSCVYKEFSSDGGAVRAALQQERLTSPPEYHLV